MKKKVLSVVLVLCLAIPMVFAGGSAEESDKITIEFWNGFDPVDSGLDGLHHEEKYAEYEQLNPGVEVVHNIMNYDQTREKAIISGQASTGPELIHMLGEWVPEFVQMGLLTDVTEAMKSWEDYDSFPASTWKVATVDGKIYGIPSVASTRVLVYREDLLQEAGLEVPKTWEDLRKAAKAMTKDTDGDGVVDVYGFAFCSSSKAVRGPQEFAVFLYSVDRGELAVQKNGKWVPGFTVEQAEKVFQFYYDLMFVDKSVPPYSIGWEWEELDPNYAAGTIAMVQNGSWMQQRMEAGHKPESWKTASFPYATNPSTYMEVKVEGFGKFGDDLDATLDFAKWLYTRDNMVYITQTDNLPSRSDSSESEHWKEDTVWKDTFLDNVQYGFTMPSIPLAPIMQASMANVQEVLYQRMSPRESAEDFYNKVKSYLDSEVNK